VTFRSPETDFNVELHTPFNLYIYENKPTVMWMRLLFVSVVPSARVHVTLGSGRPDTQQLNRTVCPTTQRLGRSRALN